MSKDLILSTRVSAEEKEIIERKALESYRTVSNYLRDCALEKRIVSVKGLDEIASELRRIGNNINQLTRAVNAGQAYEIDLRRTQERLGDIWQSLTRVSREPMPPLETDKEQESIINGGTYKAFYSDD